MGLEDWTFGTVCVAGWGLRESLHPASVPFCKLKSCPGDASGLEHRNVGYSQKEKQHFWSTFQEPGPWKLFYTHIMNLNLPSTPMKCHPNERLCDLCKVIPLEGTEEASDPRCLLPKAWLPPLQDWNMSSDIHGQHVCPWVPW